MTRYAYLHGFASSPKSSKGLRFDAAFSERGLPFHRPDLNQPDFAHLTISGALEAMDRLADSHPDETWCLIGSSMGGWVTALWALANPDRVERVALLCPGFYLIDRWPDVFGEENMARWEEEGAFPFTGGDGAQVMLHHRFVEDARAHDPCPAPPCPMLLFHGARDETVPIESSRAFVAAHSPRARLVTFDDDHRLLASADAILAQILTFFGVAAE